MRIANQTLHHPFRSQSQKGLIDLAQQIDGNGEANGNGKKRTIIRNYITRGIRQRPPKNFLDNSKLLIRIHPCQKINPYRSIGGGMFWGIQRSNKFKEPPLV
jgi:hypothetical protein